MGQNRTRRDVNLPGWVMFVRVWRLRVGGIVAGRMVLQLPSGCVMFMG